MEKYLLTTVAQLRGCGREDKVYMTGITYSQRVLSQRTWSSIFAVYFQNVWIILILSVKLIAALTKDKLICKFRRYPVE